MERTETQNKDSIVRILVNVERKQHLLCELYCSLGFQHSRCLCSSITHCIYDLFLLKLRRVSFDHSQDHVSSSTSDTTLVDDSPMQAMRRCVVKAHTICGSVRVPYAQLDTRLLLWQSLDASRRASHELNRRRCLRST